jgi:hypothetical protein
MRYLLDISPSSVVWDIDKVERVRTRRKADVCINENIQKPQFTWLGPYSNEQVELICEHIDIIKAARAESPLL